MCGVCQYRSCEALSFYLIRTGNRLKWWACPTHRHFLMDYAQWTARLWESVTGSYPSAVVLGDLQAWRTWKQQTLLAYDELRQIGV